MNEFEYTRAATIAEALDLMTSVPADATGSRRGSDAFDDAPAYLAGGTNLVDHLRLGVRTPSRVVDISLLDLGGITETTDGGLRIGANVRNADLANHPLVRQRYPFVSEALLSGASGQIRAMASTGGNLLQRTRCVYFQDVTTPCSKREPGSGCSAREGFGRYNALIGQSPECVAVHPSDLCVPLAALDARVHVVGPGGERTVPFTELHRLPGDEPWRDTTLRPGEIITAIELEPLDWATRSTYRKVRDRASYAFALISVAAALDLEPAHGGGAPVVRDARLALGGVSHKPHRASTAEDAMRGETATRETFAAAIAAELADAEAGEENAYKLPMLKRTVTSVLVGLTDGESR